MADERKIWDLLMKSIKNEYGTAAVMGNLMAESSMNTRNFTGRNTSKWYSRDEYVDEINSGRYTMDQFAHDGIAFGLAQWLFYSRKQALYEFAKGRDISSEEVQIGYLLEELPKYKTVWKAVTEAVNIQVPSDIVMEKYERPGNISEAMKQLRRKYAEQFYSKYHTAPSLEPEPAKKIKKVETTADNVLMRAGNGKEFGIITRIDKRGTAYPWVATSENGWHAVTIYDRVAWISGDYSHIIEI